MTDLSWKKRLVFTVLAGLLSVSIAELGVRVLFAFKVGPSVLLYGTPFQRRQVLIPAEAAVQSPGARPEAKTYLADKTWNEWTRVQTVALPGNESAGFVKYFPNQQRFDLDIETGERFEVTINQQGFRGRDFSPRPAPGVTRIVTLGASSTFGYFNRDDMTYPAYLERFLQEARPEAKFEVINLGIPHLASAQILALFVAEALPLEPDIVTIYAGSNDVQGITERRPGLIRLTAGRLMIAGLIGSLIDNYRTAEYLPEATANISRAFLENVSRLHQECERRGIVLVVANQQKNSQSIERARLKGLSYNAEVEMIRTRLEESQKLSAGEARMLAHAVLMKDLENWTRTNRVPFVDVISRLNRDRDVLVSWVHFSPKGNRMVAEAFAEEILKQMPETGQPASGR